LEKDDVVFEELNSDGEEMNERQKGKNKEDKLKEKFEDKIERLEKERDEYLRGWQRVQADYKNREKEIEEYKKSIIKFANSDLVKDILPVLDGYDMARSNKEQWENVDSNWRVGIEYLFSQLSKVLETNGVEVFGNEGEAYNPNLHEAIEMIDLKDEEKDKDDKIISVIQKGYKIGEKILRPARVKVGHYQE
jgi:molecular chaperone GrpE (heat shock protein)